MSGDFGLLFHLWDFADEPGTTLDRVLGEVAPDHLTVPVVTGPLERLRLKPARAPHTFVTEGGWHFPPELGSYQSGSVRPRAARWAGKQDLLGKLRDHVGRRDVKLVFRVDLRALTSLPEHEPHLRPRNAWGDDNPAAGICPLNADARELLRDTLTDLLRYEPAGFQLVDWMVDLTVSRDPGRQFTWNPLLRQLLDICFCPACRQAADVDPDRAARSLRMHVEHMITEGDEYDAVEQLNADEILRAYVEARRRDTLTWLERLAASHEQCGWSMLMDRWFDADHCFEPKTAFADLPDGSLRPVFRPPSAPLRDVDLQRDYVRPASERRLGSFGLLLPVWYPFVRQADELVRTVSAATQAGIAPLDFDGLEEAPDEALDRLRQAVRFARRG